MKVIGNRVELDGDELATAVDAYLAAHRIAVVGPRTIRIFDGNGWRLRRDTGARVVCDRIVDNREPDPELAELRAQIEAREQSDIEASERE